MWLFIIYTFFFKRCNNFIGVGLNGMYEKNNNNLVWSIFKNELDQMLFFSQFIFVDFHCKFHQNTCFDFQPFRPNLDGFKAILYFRHSIEYCKKYSFNKRVNFLLQQKRVRNEFNHNIVNATGMKVSIKYMYQ